MLPTDEPRRTASSSQGSQPLHLPCPLARKKPLSQLQPPTSRKRQALYTVGVVLLLSLGAAVAIAIFHTGGRPVVRGSSTVEFAPTHVPKQVRHLSAIVWP